jgi:membrane-associated phospholipid phosphatase
LHTSEDDVAQPSAEPPTPPHTGLRALFHNVVEDLTKLPSTQNLYIASVGGAAALAIHPVDPTFNAKLMSHSAVVNNLFAPGQYIGGSYEQVAMALATYAFGRLMDEPKVSHLGNDLLQAQILSELMIEPLKLATQRRRPYQVGACGLNCSFPSGHSSVTFADATVIERHLGWKYSVIGYAMASYVAMSRLHDNDHYVSDVVFGAAVGTIAGRTVVHHARDYWALAPGALPGGGVALFVTRVEH